MTSPYQNYQRDGLRELTRLARLLCSLLNTFAIIIRSKYGNNPAIISLLDAAQALCAALPEAQAEFDAIDTDDSAFPSDPSSINGINPSAPPAPEPTPEV